MKFVASSDLAGLGANEGPAVSYQWTRPSLLPPLLPWLGVLLLLTLRPNRTARAWWILLPLAVAMMIKGLLLTLLTFVPSEVTDLILQAVHALAFGVTAVWLTMPFLEGALRFVVFLKILMVQTAVCVFVWAVNLGGTGFGGEQAGMLISLGILSLVIAGALCLAGFHCRHRHHPVRFLLALVLWLLAGTTLAVLPFAGVAILTQGVEVALAVGGTILVAVGICLVLLLPFLVLCWANVFYRQRLQDLLHLKDTRVPPVIPLTGPLPEPTV